MSTNLNQTDLIWEAYLAEYQNVWNEILSRIDGQKQVLNLQIAVVGASVSGVAFFQAQPILYLFGALLLSLLSWVMMEQTARINAMTLYLRTILTQKIDRALPNRPEQPVLEWNLWLYSANPKHALWGLLSLVKFIIGPFIAILFCIFFAFAKQSLNQYWTNIETVLFGSNVVVILLPLLTFTKVD